MNQEILLDQESLTPMMRQWALAKKEHPDAILLFRMGDFYELFGDDAKSAAPILDLTLTSRDKDKSSMKMAGFPCNAKESYIAKLVESGQKVAICEQLEDPKNKKGIVKRGITEVVTPGTLILSDLTAYGENRLLSLVSSKERIALGSLDLASASFMVTSSKEEKDIILEAARLTPKEIIAFSDDQKVFNILENINLNKIRLEKKARQDISIRKTLSYIEYEEENLALTLLLGYLQKLQGKVPDHLPAPKRYVISDNLLIDEATRENLGVFSKKKTHGFLDNLFDVLNEAKTSMGKRALRESLSAPLTSIEKITARQNLVEELLSLPDLRKFLLEKLLEIYDLAKIVALVSANKINPRSLGALRDSLVVLDIIKNTAQNYDCKFLQELLISMPDFSVLYDTLNNALVERPPINMKDGSIFATGYSQELDDLYDLSKGGEARLLAIEERERQLTGISSLKVRYTRVFGYYIEVTKTNLDKVPAHYQRKQTIANGERYVTLELNELEVKLNNAKEAILSLEEKLFDGLKEKVKERALDLLKAAKAIGMLDMLNGLSEVASIRQYVKPQILPKENKKTMILDGRHAVAEVLCQKNGDFFIANDFSLNDEECQMALITGPNMAGKSTIMRQVALIQIMAQIGSFVPAKSALLSIVDAIFARVGASDDLASSRSTFMVEMTETAQILASATEYSLILLDEIGRGTSTYDGMAIAQAVCEYIHEKVKAKTIFATHYHELVKLEKTLSKLKNFHVKVERVGEHIQFFYKIAHGPAKESFGVEVAKLAGLPQTLIERARAVLQHFEGTQEKNDITIPLLPQMDFFNMNSLSNSVNQEIIEQIKKANINNITPLQALNKINSWQNLLRKN